MVEVKLTWGEEQRSCRESSVDQGSEGEKLVENK